MILFAIVMVGILTMWVPARWALTAFQLAILAYAAVRIARGRLRFHPVGIALACVAAWGLLQVAAGWSVNAFKTEEAVLDWVVRLAAFGVAVEFADSARRRFLDSLLVFAAVLSVIAMVTAFSSPPGVIAWRFEVGTKVPTLGPFVYRNQYAAFVEAVLPLMLLRAFREPGRVWIYGAGAGLLFASVVASGSRAGTVLCIAELVAVAALAGGRAGWRAMAGIGAVVGGLTLVAGWEPIWARFQETNPYGLRWNLLQSSLAMVAARPITGWGLGTWSEAYPGFARYDDGTFVNQAHNDWAQWAVEGGVPLFLLMLFVLLFSVRPAFRTIWGIGLVGVFLHCFVDYPMQQRPPLAVFFFVLLGLLLRTVELRSTLKSDPSQP